MIKIKDLVQKYGEYSIDEEKLKELLVSPKSKTAWDLKSGDTFYYIIADGGVSSCTWTNDISDYEARDMGNCFLTQKEAEFEVERRKCEAIMLKHGTRDMEFLLQVINYAYYIYYDYGDDTVKISCSHCVNGDYTHCVNMGYIYFPSAESAQKAINEIEEYKIKKYIFNVK